jgi:signal peptidase
MSPAFERGDILALTMYSDPLKVGDICVFNIAGKDIPIVHRIHKVHEM